MPIKPLTKEEIRILSETAESDGHRRHAVLIPNIVPFSGLSISEFRHLREDWINWSEDQEPIEIKIPAEAECSPVKLEHGYIVRSTQPCYWCKKTKGPDKFTVENDYRVRLVHVQETRAKDQLRNWFSRNDYIPFTQPMIVLGNLVDRSPLDRNVTWLDLRFTYARILGDRGFDPNDISKWLGFPTASNWSGLSKTLARVLRSSNTQYRKRVRLIDCYECLKENQPMTNQEMAERLGKSPITMHKRTRRLLEMGWAKQIGRRDQEKTGRNPKEFVAIDGVDLTHECEGCGKDFDTKIGLSVHENSCL